MHGHRARKSPLSAPAWVLLTHHSVSQAEWSAELQFRATGPERASGILQLWYTKDGQAKIGTSSIYTAGPFDGFALVIDMHGGRVCWPINSVVPGACSDLKLGWKHPRLLE